MPSSHPVKADSPEPLAATRAKPLPRVEVHGRDARTEMQGRAAAIVSTALVAAGVTDQAAGRALRVDGSTMREFRTGKRDISLARVMQLPAPVRREIFRRAEAAMQEESPMAIVNAPEHMARLITELGELGRALAAGDKQRTLTAVRALIRRAEALETDTERAIAKEQGR